MHLKITYPAIHLLSICVHYGVVLHTFVCEGMGKRGNSELGRGGGSHQIWSGQVVK